MIVEKTKKALEILFPRPKAEQKAEQKADDAPPVSTTAESEEQETPKDEPRPNGLIERDYAVHGYHLDAQIAPEQLLDAVEIVDGLEFFLESITGVDWIKDDQMEIVYDFSRYDFDLCRVVIRTRVARDTPVVPTITPIYAGANWHERETHDFFGITFDGHPHLIPLLLPEDADFHPLLKDFKA
ncbi:MAG: NADH-quinone oxidoreductase subunit C [Desulfopila sp.]